MNKDRWQQIEKIFSAAMELPRDERDDFVDGACTSDEELRREVLSLLAANREANSFLNSPIAIPPQSGALSPTLAIPPAISNSTSDSKDGIRVGPYRLLREIGRGGMGAVWLAERADGQFRQHVAIKLLHAGAENEEISRRFRHERQILAGLDHSNIARLLDGGTTEDGRPYFVMEHIEGLPIDEYCRRHQLSVDDRLRLFRQVCTAVHYAHQNLVIHRDLKPGNIVVTEDGVPKLLDFGIAKLIHPDLSQSYDTLSGITPMTPAYASPEQVRGEKLTTASDVYSLGVVLYELLTGRSPYRLKANTFGELMQAVGEQEPERPSTAITHSDDKSNAAPVTIESVDKLRRRLAGDIDSIVLMALRKEPGARYGSAEQFSEDLRRYLEGMPTRARRGTFGYHALKYIRRNKVPVAAAVLILLSLLGGIGATLRQARIARAAQLQAEAEKSQAQSQRNRVAAALTIAEERRQQAEAAHVEADLQRDEATAQRIRAETQELSNRRLLYTSQMRLAQTAWDESNIQRVRELLASHIPQPAQQDLRGFEWNWLWKISHTEIADFPHKAVITSVAVSPDGASLMTIERESEILTMAHETLRIWQISTGKEKYRIRGRFAGDIGRLSAFSSDGKIFITGGFSCGISVWETGSGKRLRKIAESICNFLYLAIAQDGKKVAVARPGGKISIYDIQSGEELLALKGASIAGTVTLEFSPDGQILAGFFAGEKLIKLWDTKSGNELLTLSKEVRGVKPAFSPNGRYLVAGLMNGEALVIDVLTGQETAKIKLTGLATSIAFSVTGKVLAVATQGQISFWNSETWQRTGNITGFGALISAMAFLPDESQLVTGAYDSSVKLWDLKRSQEPANYKLDQGYVDKLAFSRDGKRLFVFGSDLATRVIDTFTTRELYSLKGHFLEKPYMNPTTLLHGLVLSENGKRLATTADESIRIWDTSTARELLLIKTPGWNNYSIALSQDGRMVSTEACPCGATNTDIIKHAPSHFTVWDTTTGQVIFGYNGNDIGINRIVFLKDNKTIVTGGLRGGGQLTWWNLSSGRSIKTLNIMKRGIYSLTLSPDGKRFAVGDGNGMISLLDAQTGLTTINIKGHNALVREISFSPDGYRLLTGSSDRTAKLWDLTTGQELMVFRDIFQTAGSAFSSDGRSITIAYPQGVVKVFTSVRTLLER